MSEHTYCGAPEPTEACEALGYCDYHAGTGPDGAAGCSLAAIESWDWYVEARREAAQSHLVEASL